MEIEPGLHLHTGRHPRDPSNATGESSQGHYARGLFAELGCSGRESPPRGESPSCRAAEEVIAPARTARAALRIGPLGRDRGRLRAHRGDCCACWRGPGVRFGLARLPPACPVGPQAELKIVSPFVRSVAHVSTPGEEVMSGG
ncbi:hypothetical protein [Nonomuraea dietziae]|uniref:hypothetical protein n=1 Tax=Nonomuraea dietziae TaxID=65515 RepID=UPI0031CFF6F3